MRVTSSKSRNAESFYITQSYTDEHGKSSSRVIRRLGTLAELQEKLGTDRDGVVAWAKEQARIETEKYRQAEEQGRTVMVSFDLERVEKDGQRRLFTGGYLFLQKIFCELKLDQICAEIQSRRGLDFDLKTILRDLVCARILDPDGKRSPYEIASEFIEAPAYQPEDIRRAIPVLAAECEAIQSALYENSAAVCERNDRVLLYDRVSCKFEAAQRDLPWDYPFDPPMTMELFMDGDGIPLSFSLSPGSGGGQKPLSPLEARIFRDFAHATTASCVKSGPERDGALPGEGKPFLPVQEVQDLPEEEQAQLLRVSRKTRRTGPRFRVISADFEGPEDNCRQEDRIQAHFLVCFLSLLVYRVLDKKLGGQYSSPTVLDTLRGISFVLLPGQGYLPRYTRTPVTDALHDACHFVTDFQFIVPKTMQKILKQSASGQ